MRFHYRPARLLACIHIIIIAARNKVIMVSIASVLSSGRWHCCSKPAEMDDFG